MVPYEPIDEKEPFCPECGEVLERDGIATLNGDDEYGPWYCIDCGWAETFDGPYEDEDDLNHL